MTTWFFPDTDTELGELLKAHWHRYKKIIILLACCVFGGIFAWQQHTEYTAEQSREASLLMSNMIHLMKTSQPMDQIQRVEEQLTTNYPNTPYASLAKMILARHYISQHQLDKGITLYEEVININHDPAINQVAHLRLARLWIAQEQGKKALGVLDRIKKWDFESSSLEVRGDAYWQTKNYKNAFNAYDKSLSSLPKASNWEPVAMRLKQKKNHMLLKIDPTS